MTTIADQLTAISTSLSTLATQNQQILAAIQAQSPAKAEDLTPVTTAIAGVQTSVNAQTATVNAIAAKLRSISPPLDRPLLA